MKTTNCLTKGHPTIPINRPRNRSLSDFSKTLELSNIKPTLVFKCWTRPLGDLFNTEVEDVHEEDPGFNLSNINYSLFMNHNINLFDSNLDVCPRKTHPQPSISSS